MSISKAKKPYALVLIWALVAAGGLCAQEDAPEQEVPEQEVPADAEINLTVTDAPVTEDIGMACRFTRECLEAEPCSDAGFTAQLDARAGGLDPEVMMVEAMMITEVGNTFLVGARDNGNLSLSGGAFEARHVLTVTQPGDARYTVHYVDGPMMVSYLGTCEAEQ